MQTKGFLYTIFQYLLVWVLVLVVYLIGGVQTQAFAATQSNDDA